LERLVRDLDNRRIQKIGRVVIEAAATAGPAAIVTAILSHPYLSLRFAVDGIVAVLGADVAEVLATRADVVHQVAVADVIAVRDVSVPLPNATALVLDAATAPAGSFTGHGPFDAAKRDPESWLGIAHPDRMRGLAGEAAHIASFAVQRSAILSAPALERFLEYVVALQGPRLIRLRAAVATGPSDVMIAESYGAFFLPPQIIEREDAARFGIRFVVSARDFGEEAFAAYLDAFLNEARIDTPDRRALTENPLAIAGFSARGGR